ncbi:MAG: trypsin-like peptidase domain-containing protein [Promicromonosporaceae bacterium]|nr:trypsin-like peptidase domain-containing protein [Promicromonosporaceae bacterium]
MAAQRRPRLWLPVTAAALGAALVASGATVALTRHLDDSRGHSPVVIPAAAPTPAGARPVGQGLAPGSDWATIAAAVTPSVVSIDVDTNAGGGQGSGMILDAQGHVMTNAHVVVDAIDGIVAVTLTDGRLFWAELVGADSLSDVAVVRLEDPPDDLVPVELGDSSLLVVGEPVLAIGNPLGLSNTATTGIISALDRPVSAGESLTNPERAVTNAIQIDAAINPGNSGGPLFDASGQVIGITSSIQTISMGPFGGMAGSIGLGFAIPSNHASNIAQQLIATGSAQHALLGVSIASDYVEVDGATRRGATVTEITAGGPADDAGLRVGDVIITIDGRPLTGADSLTAFVRERAIGSTVTLALVRDGQRMETTAVLSSRPDRVL